MTDRLVEWLESAVIAAHAHREVRMHGNPAEPQMRSKK